MRWATTFPDESTAIPSTRTGEAYCPQWLVTRPYRRLLPSCEGATFQSTENLDCHPGARLSNAVGPVSGLPMLAQAETATVIMPSVSDLASILMVINAAFNARDVDRILSFFDDDATFLMARGPEPNGRRVHGKAAIGKVLADRFKVISDMRWDHIEHFVTGNRAVSVWMVTGTSADGEALNYQGCDIYELRGNKILNKDTYW